MGGSMIHRRTFNTSLLALGLGALLPSRTRAAMTGGLIATGFDTLRARHMVTRLDADLSIRWDLALPARGHGAEIRPGADEGLVIARRSGTFAIVFGLSDGDQRHHIKATTGRHFYGHAAYSADGSTLFVTENDFDTGLGIIGIYDAGDGYKRLGEFKSGGIGPHQMLLMADGGTLVVANGGIRTHPDQGRRKLNLATMQPSLAFIDSVSGYMTGQAFFKEARQQKLSIRHIALTEHGVAAGCQNQGKDGARLPLVYMHTGQAGLLPLPVPDSTLAKFNGYCGSVAYAAETDTLAASSPRGGLVGFWRMADAAWLGHTNMPDGCGLAPVPGAGIAVSSGDGSLRNVGAGLHQLYSTRHRFRRWDNHMTAITG